MIAYGMESQSQPLHCYRCRLPFGMPCLRPIAHCYALGWAWPYRKTHLISSLHAPSISAPRSRSAFGNELMKKQAFPLHLRKRRY